MISIGLSDVFLDGLLTQPRDVVVSFEGRLSLGCDGLVYFEDEFFPVVELAVALSGWLRLGEAIRPDFDFEAMSAEEPGILWFRSFDGSWRVGSIWQDSPCAATVTLQQLDDLALGYVSTVRDRVLSVGGRQALTWLDRAISEGFSDSAGGRASGG